MKYRSHEIECAVDEQASNAGRFLSRVDGRTVGMNHRSYTEAIRYARRKVDDAIEADGKLRKRAAVKGRQ